MHPQLLVPVEAKRENAFRIFGIDEQSCRLAVLGQLEGRLAVGELVLLPGKVPVDGELALRRG